MKRGQKKDAQPHSPSQLRPEVRKRLEAAALEVFSATDFHRASIREVAKNAGVSFASIYKYYGSKEGLIFSCLDSAFKGLSERLLDHLQGISDLKEKLRKAVWVELDFYERHPDIGQIIFLTIPFKKWMEDQTFKQEKFINVYLEVFRQGQRDGRLNSSVRPGIFLDFIHGLVQWRFIMWIYRGQKNKPTKDFNTVFEMLWRAISNPDREKDR
jgi:AcrR family transcriptional regulator